MSTITPIIVSQPLQPYAILKFITIVIRKILAWPGTQWIAKGIIFTAYVFKMRSKLNNVLRYK